MPDFEWLNETVAHEPQASLTIRWALRRGLTRRPPSPAPPSRYRLAPPAGGRTDLDDAKAAAPRQRRDRRIRQADRC